MKESLKKPLLFLVIVVIGSVMVLFDIPLLILLPLLIIIGFATLLALGSITIAEIRAGISGLGKSGLLKRLNEIKFFEKKPGGVATAPVKSVPKADAKTDIRKDGGQKSGVRGHISAFVSSVRSLGAVMHQRSKKERKVEDINKLLDRTVSEKVPEPSPAKPAPAAAPPKPAAAGGGAASDDPFVSLSGDEFDEELLKGLGDDMGTATPTAPEPAAPAAPAASLSMPDLPDVGVEADLPVPELDIDAVAGDILKQAGEEAETLPIAKAPESKEGEETAEINAEFGDLENLSLDDIDFGEAEAVEAAEEVAPAGQPAAASPQAASGAGSDAVKTAWVPSDAPKDAAAGAEDEVSTQADMAAFASGAGTDEDLLSSIASDVKRTKKEQDISLVRELKDFRAPASEIEQELGGMFERMNLAQETQKKKTTPKPSPSKTKK